MNKNDLAVWAGALACGLPLATAAQAGATDPTRSAQQTPALRYDSAFKDYKPWQDTKPADWRGVNDALKDALKDGNHAGHGVAAPAGAGSVSTPAAARPAASAARSAAPATSPAASHGGPSDHGGRK